MAALHEHDEEDQISVNSNESSTSPVQGVTKEDVRRYFSEVTCNPRVLGSHLGLEPYELDDPVSLRKQSDPKQSLVDECFKKGKLRSWQQLADVLERPALNQGAIANKIRREFSSRQSSLESSAGSRTSSLQSPQSPMEISGKRIWNELQESMLCGDQTKASKSSDRKESSVLSNISVPITLLSPTGEMIIVRVLKIIIFMQ